MYKNKTIAVVVPCFNEEILISRVITTMPDFVDYAIIVDDKSSDRTATVIQEHIDSGNKKVVLVSHAENGGVGAAIASGYKKALEMDLDIAVVVAGDAQMDPDEMPLLLDPIIEHGYDYSKGNRLFTGDAWNKIPRVRYLGNSMLSLLTKIASGYWHVADSQCGYTAINKRALKTIDWDHMYKRYGQPNDLLVRLNVYNFKVCDVPVTPIYGVGEKSGIKPFRIIPRLSKLLFKLYLFRMLQKYIIRDFHPLVFFYMFGAVFWSVGFLLGVYLLFERVLTQPVAATSAIFSALLLMSGVQLVLFAMWMDMDYNRDLK